MTNIPRLIDTDVHNSFASATELMPYIPRSWRELLRGHIRTPGNCFVSPISVSREDARTPTGGRPGSDPAYLIEHHLDPYDIDYAILTGSGMLGISLLPDPDYANMLATAFNDWQIEHWLSFSPRFKGSIFINHSDPEAAAAEIDRVAEHPDLVQVIMASGSSTPFGQRRFHPIYAAAARHGLPIAIHPGTEGIGTAGPATPCGHPTRYMEWHNILPTNYMAHVNSLVCEGVFEKFPTLKFVCIEGGIAWLPHLMWRMDKNFKGLRSTTPWLKRLPSEYIIDHIRLTTQPIEESPNPKHIVQIFEMIQADKIVMFSSDYPHWDFDNPKMALPPLPREMKARIFATNAAELYGLHESPLQRDDVTKNGVMEDSAEKNEVVGAAKTL